MTAIKLDDRRWPILRIEFPEEFTQAEWEAHIPKVLAYARKREPFAIVNDAGRCPPLTALQRKQLAESVQNPSFRANVVAVGVVINNPILRFVVQVITMFAPVACPHEHFSSVVDAEVWCRKHLSEKRCA